MGCCRFFGFITILKESIQLFGKNSKMMALVTTLSMISYSIFFFIFSASSNLLLLNDMLVKESMIPISSSLISKIISDATGITSNLPKGFLPLYFIITFLSTTATVTVSSYSCSCASYLTLKELSSILMKSWTRPFVTAFYTTVSVVGYESLTLYLAIPLLTSSLESSNLAARAAALLYGVAACGLYLYVSCVWILSLVVAVVEEDGGGIAAIGKSAEIIKGRKLDAFLLNVFVNFIYFVVLVGWSVMMKGDHGKVWGVVLVNFCCLVRVLTFVGYTVLYFGVNESAGYEREVELHGGDVEYAKLGVIPLVEP